MKKVTLTILLATVLISCFSQKYALFKENIPTYLQFANNLLIDDVDARIEYDSTKSYGTDFDTNCIAYTQHYTTQAGLVAALNFKGDFVALYFYQEQGGGIMNVYIDGKQYGYIDCGTTLGKTQYSRTAVYGNLGEGKHRIALYHTGVPYDKRKPRAVFNKYFVNIDGFSVSMSENLNVN